MLRLMLKKNSFQFNRKNYLQIHGTAMGTKMAIAFANIFMADLETQILRKSVIKPMIWKQYIDNIFFVVGCQQTGYRQVHHTSKLTPPYHQINFTAEISNTEATFLDTAVYKGKRFQNQSILDIKTHFNPTETFQYAHFSSSHPPGVKKGFVKGKALKTSMHYFLKNNFDENIYKFKSRLKCLIETLLSDIKFTERESAPKQRNEISKDILPWAL